MYTSAMREYGVLYFPTSNSKSRDKARHLIVDVFKLAERYFVK